MLLPSLNALLHGWAPNGHVCTSAQHFGHRLMDWGGQVGQFAQPISLVVTLTSRLMTTESESPTHVFPSKFSSVCPAVHGTEICLNVPQTARATMSNITHPFPFVPRSRRPVLLTLPPKCCLTHPLLFQPWLRPLS